MALTSTELLGAPMSSSPVRVAIADDDPLARFAIEEMVRRADGLLLVGVAADVEEIVGMAALQQPDAIVLDWIMPGGGGAEAARRILGRIPDMCILTLTSSDSPEALLEMTCVGVRCFMVKGCSANDLSQTIRQALGLTR